MEKLLTPQASADGKMLKLDLSQYTWQETVFVLSLMRELGPKLGVYTYMRFNIKHSLYLLEKLINELGLDDYVCGSFDCLPDL